MLTREIENKLRSFPTCIVFDAYDLGVDQSQFMSVMKVLAQMTNEGKLFRASAGRYYLPLNTPLGKVGPDRYEYIKDLLEYRGEPIGYETGVSAFSNLGLTNQISTITTIGSNNRRGTLMRGTHKVTFWDQPNKITRDNIDSLRLLDAIRHIDKMPATTPDEAIKRILSLLKQLSKDEKSKLVTLAMAYPPRTRALLGALLDAGRADTSALRQSLNPGSVYKIGISSDLLPSATSWRIL